MTSHGEVVTERHGCCEYNLNGNMFMGFSIAYKINILLLYPKCIIKSIIKGIFFCTIDLTAKSI